MNRTGILRTAELPLVDKMKGSGYQFLQFSVEVTERNTKTLEIIYGWGNPSLFLSLNAQNNFHTDTSFCTFPQQYTQILDIMSRDEQAEAHAKDMGFLMAIEF